MKTISSLLLLVLMGFYSSISLAESYYHYPNRCALPGSSDVSISATCKKTSHTCLYLSKLKASSTLSYLYACPAGADWNNYDVDQDGLKNSDDLFPYDPLNGNEPENEHDCVPGQTREYIGLDIEPAPHDVGVTWQKIGDSACQSTATAQDIPNSNCNIITITSNGLPATDVSGDPAVMSCQCDDGYTLQGNQCIKESDSGGGGGDTPPDTSPLPDGATYNPQSGNPTVPGMPQAEHDSYRVHRCSVSGRCDGGFCNDGTGPSIRGNRLKCKSLVEIGKDYSPEELEDILQKMVKQGAQTPLYRYAGRDDRGKPYYLSTNHFYYSSQFCISQRYDFGAITGKLNAPKMDNRVACIVAVKSSGGGDSGGGGGSQPKPTNPGAGGDGDCDPKSSDYFECMSVTESSERFDGYTSLDDEIDKARTDYKNEIENVLGDFKDKIQISVNSQSPFYSDKKEVFDVEVEFGTVIFENALVYVPSIILLMAGISASVIVLGGYKS